MSEPNWDEIEPEVVPQGTFIGWGKVGQTVIGEVVAYEETGGSDFNGDPCPLLVMTLTAGVDNYRDKGTTRERLAAGDLVSLTCGQAQLARLVKGAAPTSFDWVRIEFTGTYKTGKGEGKEFSVKVARRSEAPADERDLFGD